MSGVFRNTTDTSIQTNMPASTPEAVEIQKNNKPFPHDANTKPTNVFQRTLSEMQTNSPSKQLIDFEIQPLTENFENGRSEGKAESLGLPILIPDADLKKINKYGHMDLEQLSVALETNPEDADIIFSKIVELDAKRENDKNAENEKIANLENQKNETTAKVVQELIPDSQISTENSSQSIAAALESAIDKLGTTNVHFNKLKDQNYEDLRFLINGAIESIRGDNYKQAEATITPQGDIFAEQSILDKYRSLFSNGQPLPERAADGTITQGQIIPRNIITVTEEEMEEFRIAFKDYLNTLNMPVPEEAPKKHTEAPSQLKLKDIEPPLDKKETRKEAINDKALLRDAPQTNTKNTKEWNEQRIKAFIEYLDQKSAKIKKEVHDNEIKQNDTKTSNDNKEKLLAENTKLDAQYKLMTKADKAPLPSATIKKFHVIEIRYKQLQTFLPPNKDAQKIPHETLKDAVGIKKEMVIAMNEIIDSAGTSKQNSAGHSGKTSFPAA